MRTNKRAVDDRKDHETRLAGGFGEAAARQDAEQLLRRVVLANLLWEDQFYQDGESVADQVRSLVPQVAPETVASLAHEARVDQKLRHVPLLLARECARHESHRHVVSDVLYDVVRRPDEITEFLSLYWGAGDRRGRDPLTHGVKRGLARAFGRFDAYQLAKWDRPTQIKLRDAMFLVHPKPRDAAQERLFRQLVDGQLPAPDTWEVALSSGTDRKASWERLIKDRKLGALAFMKNLRNMENDKVSSSVIREGFKSISAEWLLPLDYFRAAEHAPQWQPEIEQTMISALGHFPKLDGETVLIVDVSGSMWASISSRSTFSRLDAAAAMAVLAREMCEHVQIWVTAGDDWTRTHKTALVRPYRGFALADEIRSARGLVGGGGIFTRQCLEYVREHSGDRLGDRTIVFSDSQDCDVPGKRVPRPFSPRNYIVDVSAHERGVNYRGVWTAEISGWSEHFLRYVQAMEAQGGN